MASIYLPDDHGNAIVVNGVAYHRIGQVVHQVTHTPTGADSLDIEGFDASETPNTYGTVGNGIWTACQHAVSMMAENAVEKECVVPDGTEENTVVGNIYVAPSNGVLFLEGTFAPFLYIDGVRIEDTGLTGDWLIRLLGGQTLQFGQHPTLTTERTGTAITKFRPDVYP